LLHKRHIANVKRKGFLTFDAAFTFMGRCTRTVGERRLGRTIYKLGNSVELSSKEGKAKLEEQTLKRKTLEAQGYTDDSPVENLRDASKRKEQQSKH
jgi:hypothetical protein